MPIWCIVVSSNTYMMYGVTKLRHYKSRRLKYHQYSCLYHLCILHYHLSLFWFLSTNKNGIECYTRLIFFLTRKSYKSIMSSEDIKSYCLNSCDDLYPPFYRLQKWLKDEKVFSKIYFTRILSPIYDKI